ncbi:integrase [Bradyrhizobium sp. USDA 4501]
MSFRMIQPWVNPRSEFYWFRRRVPKAYRTFGMPSEIKFSLGTKDWDEAVLRCQEENLKLERQWRGNIVGTPPTELSHLQITALAGEFYAETVAAHLDDPGRAVAWEQSLRKLDERRRAPIGPLGPHLHMMFGSEARAFLQRKSVLLVGERLESFLRAYVEAKEHASKTLLSAAKFDYKPAANPPYYPKFEPPNPAMRFEALWEEFVKARMIAASTKKKWKPYFAQLIKRVGGDDMSRVTEQHLLDWRDALLATKLSPVTVRYGYIASAQAFFGWAKRAKKLPYNPAAEVVVEVTEKHEMDMRGFDDAEAATILAAALAPMNETMTEENAAARKWVPWLCAYTGARVNEITQLRACDIVEAQGIPCIRITPEAGTVKTSRKRTVPLHPHLLDMKFVEWAQEKSGSSPLFYSEARQRKPDRLNPAYTSVGNKLADWVRKLGIKDPTVAPNHGWRHRFKTVARRAKMDAEVRDAIQGHAPRTEGEDYGEVPADVMLPEILKHPWYTVEVPTERRDRRRRGRRRIDQAASV